ncbi:hypothetical protein [Rhodococcus sp. BS-15]|uniref:hypothetical protein n=1 Tax=Rhodococcus sp. BS-15 TaxID=1304954 RepID=UPI000AE39734|nr:hypothetical protein [Rhodococcus sp. BS-15]
MVAKRPHRVLRPSRIIDKLENLPVEALYLHNFFWATIAQVRGFGERNRVTVVEVRVRRIFRGAPGRSICGISV